MMSADQINSPAGSQLTELNNTPKTSFTDSQKTAVPDTKETFHNEGSWKKTLSGKKDSWDTQYSHV